MIETGTGPVRLDVCRVYERGIGTVRRIIQRVAIGVGPAHRYRTAGAPDRSLQSVILRIRNVLQTENPLEADVFPLGVGIGNAGKTVTGRHHVYPRWLGLSYDHAVYPVTVGPSETVVEESAIPGGKRTWHGLSDERLAGAKRIAVQVDAVVGEVGGVGNWLS